MALLAKQPENTGSHSEPVSAGMHLAVCYAVIDIGEQYSEKFQNSRRKIIIIWETDEEMVLDDGTVKPKVISKEFGLSLHEKSDLRKTLTSWRGRDFTNEELQGFDLKNILGAPCLLNVVETKKEDRTYHNIGSITPLIKGQKAFELYNPKTLFELTEQTIDEMEDRLPKWIVEKIKKSTTYGKLMAQKSGSPQRPALTPMDDDEPLPF